jgi:hypothetical protein
MTTEGQGRDIRIDVIRGLALWMIFTDHIAPNPVRYLTYHNFGYSDAGEIFIFLCGLSCSLLYGKLIARAGLLWAQLRALHRVAEIYVGYVFVVFACFAAVLACADRLGLDYLKANDFDLLVAAPGRALVAAAYLYYTPGNLDILQLYLILVAATPVALLALERAPARTLAASAALWLAAELVPALNLPNLIASGVAGWNPFSCQFLFCVGLWAGKRWYRDGRPFRPQRWLEEVCWAVIAANLAATALYKLGQGPGNFHWALLDTLHALARSGLETPVRLTHFLAAAYLTACHLPADARFLRSAWLRPLVLCGRHSLEAFCCGLVLSQIADLAFQISEPGLLPRLLVNPVGWGAMACIAALFELKARPLPQAPAGAAVSRPHAFSMLRLRTEI